MSLPAKIRDLLSAHDHLVEAFPTSPETVDVAVTPIRSRANLFPKVPGYRLMKELGQGGMGVVYLAEQTSLNRMVALKMLNGAGHAEAEARMRQEAAALARVSHPNVVSVYEVGEADGRTYFAIEYLAGGSLEDRLSVQLYAPRDAAVLLRTIANAIQVIHDRGLLHCDLKPANVLLAEDGTPKVADFGLARLLNDDQRQTRTGTIRGTPCYMPPEQADGLLGSFGPAVDVYALGGILYEVLTGRPPFLGSTVLETLDQVRKLDPVPVRTLQPQVPRDLETICMKCLSKPAEKRYATAAELAAELDRFLNHMPILARPPGKMERATQWCRRNPSRAALVAVCIAGMLVAVVAAGWVHRRLDQDLHRTETARDEARTNARIAHATLVKQAAERIDAEMRELTVRPQAVAAAVELQSSIDEAYYRNWLGKLVESDPRIDGLCVAMEPDGETGFALLVQRREAGIVHRRMDREGLVPPYWKRPWFSHRNEWSEPYLGTDAAKTPMVSYTVPIRKGDRIAGVVVVDVALARLQSLRAELKDLIPDIDERSVLTTALGTILHHPDDDRAFPAKSTGPLDKDPEASVISVVLPTTQWKLSVFFPHE